MLMPVPLRAKMAQPPEPIVLAVGRAAPMQWLQPSLRAVVPADFLADSLKIFVSWRRTKSSAEELRMLPTAEAHELGFDDKMDHRPIVSHHRFSSVDEGGIISFWVVEKSSGRFLIADCLLVTFLVFLVPSLFLCLRALLVRKTAAMWATSRNCCAEDL